MRAEGIPNSGMTSRLSRRPLVGIAIGAEMLYVAPISDGRYREKSFPAWTTQFPNSLLDASEDQYEMIRDALMDCPHLSRAKAALAYVVVLPPLALGRRVSLPRLSEAEYRQVLARDSFRYFATDRSPRVVGVLPLSSKESSPVPVFAASASTRIVDSVVDAVRDVGCELASLDCAYASWTAAATTIWPSLARSKSAVIVCQDDVTEIIYSEGNGPEIVRRVSANAPAEQLLAALGMYAKGSPPRACAILGPTARYNEWGSMLSEAGVAVMPSTPASRLDGGTLSAMFAAAGRGPGLYPERMYAESRAESQRLAMGLGLAAGVLLIVSAALLLGGLKRELRATVAQRESIRPAVAQALDIRSNISGLDLRSARIATLTSTSARWSAVLSSISEAIPSDAHLTNIRVRGDTVVLEGNAGRAAGVFEGLQRNPDITAVRSSAPVRQQLQEGSPVERFTVTARIAPPPAPPPAPRPDPQSGGRG